MYYPRCKLLIKYFYYFFFYYSYLDIIQTYLYRFATAYEINCLQYKLLKVYLSIVTMFKVIGLADYN